MPGLTKPLSPSERAAIAERLALGHVPSAIAKDLGISASSVRRQRQLSMGKVYRKAVPVREPASDWVGLKAHFRW